MHVLRKRGIPMDSGGVVTVSADRILELADRMKDLESEIRQLGLDGFMSQPITRAPPRQKSNSELMAMQFDLTRLDWKKSNRAGGGDAGPDEKWAWTYGYPDADSPDPRTECYALVEALIQYGEIRVGKYTVKLAGRDNRLLNRKIAK